MKVTAVNNTQNNSAERSNNNHHHKNVQFKNLLGYTDTMMSGIQSKGFLVSFLIQDGLGMTFPRVLTGLYRDRSTTGEYNYAEAMEVFLREAITGPYMMVVAPLMLAIAGKFCKSANTNTRLIKILGNNMKSMIKDSAFDKSVMKDSAKFQDAFHRYNIEKFYNTTIPNDKNSKETVEYLLKEFKNYNSNDKSLRKQSLSNINKKINDKILETSTDLDNFYKMSIEVDGQKKLFNATQVLNAIRDYSNDAIINNKHFAEIDEAAAENIKNNFATKRLLLNTANIAATLGGLSVIPKIYARGNVAPGAAHLVKTKDETNQNNNQKSEQNINFKGKGINSKGLFSRIGKTLTKYVPEWVQKELEYNDYNFTSTLMASLALFGLLLPRGKKAYDRALVDDNGNKDLSEVKEILVRDTTSALSVVFTAPILTKIFVSSLFEKNKGFVLTNRASQNKTGFKKFLDVINPYSALKEFSCNELEALYNNIDTKTKMLNFCKYIDKKGGDLARIIAKSKNANLILKGQELSQESSLNIADKNKKIIDFINGLKGKEGNELIKKVMQDSGKEALSSITKTARGYNSVPGFLSTVIISPIILGCLIPLLTYANTRKAHAKMFENQQNKQV